MALKSTIFKATLQISDMNRHYYAAHDLTIARHPSETDRRMMLRILAFCIHADEALSFTKGLSTDDEPDLWQRDPTGDIEHWVDLGQPDEKRIRKACGRAKQVTIFSYNQRSSEVWWQQTESKLDRFNNLAVVRVPDAALEPLETLAQRSMELQYSSQDNDIWLGDGASSVHVQLESLKSL